MAHFRRRFEPPGKEIKPCSAVWPGEKLLSRCPRDDVSLTVDGVAVKPFAGVGSWAAFTRLGTGAMMMGDTVVFQDEVNPAIEAAFANGLEVTGLHNHFLFDQPKVFFMHIGGHGNPEKLAAGVKAVWDAIKTYTPGVSIIWVKPTIGSPRSCDLSQALNDSSEVRHLL